MPILRGPMRSTYLLKPAAPQPKKKMLIENTNVVAVAENPQASIINLANIP